MVLIYRSFRNKIEVLAYLLFFTKQIYGMSLPLPIPADCLLSRSREWKRDWVTGRLVQVGNQKAVKCWKKKLKENNKINIINKK